MTGVRRVSVCMAAYLSILLAAGCGAATSGSATSGTAKAVGSKPAPSPTARASSPSSPHSLPTVVVAEPSVNTDFAPMALGEAKGFYQKRGVRVSLETMRVPVEIAALIGGRVQFITVGGVGAEAAWTGAPVRLVAGIDIHPAYVLVARPNIRSPAQLKGKSVGTNSSQSALSQMTSWILYHRYGVAPRQVTYVGLGADAKKIAALRAGGVAAVSIGAALAVNAVAGGMHRLFGYGRYLTIPFTSLVASTAYMHSHPARVRAVVRGTVEAIDFMRQHRAQTIRFYESYYHLTSKQAQTAYVIERKAYTPDGRFPASAVRTVLAMGQEFAQAGGQTPKHPVPAKLSAAQIARIVDFSFLPPAASGAS